MQSFPHIAGLVLGVSLAWIPCACGPTPVPMVPGPETPGLVDAFEGHILMDRPVGGLVSVALPSRTETELRVPGQAWGTVHSLSGPDARGRVAYIENHGIDDRHRLIVSNLDGGPEHAVFDHEGDALWGNEVGDYLALSPSSGLVALTADMSALSVRSPDAYLKRGRLALWNVDDGTQLELELTALEDHLSWFPDGERLVYVDLVPREEALQLAGEASDGVETFGDWEELPVVHLLAVDTAESRAVSVGWHPLASADGRSVLIADFAGKRRVVDVESGRSAEFELPGLAPQGPIGFLDGKHVLYWAYPTEGTEERWSEHNSPLAGRKSMLALKIAEWNTRRFETVVPFVDPRRSVSFATKGP